MSEFGIWKVAIPDHPGQKKFTRPHLNGKKAAMVMYTCYPSDSGKCKEVRWFRLAWTKGETLSPE
jgi:hypothetical protein